MRLYAVLCMCGIFKNTLHKLRGWGGSGGSGVMCILNSLQHSPEMCVFFPQRNVSPSLQPLRCLSVCHLDCSSVTSDVISVYLSLFATFPNSRSVSWVPLSHCMTIHSPNSALETSNVRVFLDASRKGSRTGSAERQVTRLEAQILHALQQGDLVSFYIHIYRQEHLLRCIWIGILDFTLPRRPAYTLL